MDRFSLVHVLSREGQELSSLHGRLDAARIGLLLPGLLRPGEIDDALLCGPEGFAEEATRALLAYGVPAERVQAERFIPTGQPSRRPAPPVAPDAPPAALLRVTVDGLTRQIPVAEGETLLEAGLRAGLDLPWSCRGGMCCTCRAQLTEGEAAMDQNWSLTPAEQAKGFVLTCQSRPKTRELALDYDAA
jgi:ring-1,2-phenylacetyl-CoA epoxidase subunit PaaE